MLLNLAALRNGLVALGSLALLDWQASVLDPLMATALVPCNAALIALVSADVLERALRTMALGYADNVNVSPRGELEGWNGPTRREHENGWRLRMFLPVFPDDPGPGHYPFPIPTFWGRVRALWP